MWRICRMCTIYRRTTQADLKNFPTTTHLQIAPDRIAAAHMPVHAGKTMRKELRRSANMALLQRKQFSWQRAWRAALRSNLAIYASPALPRIRMRDVQDIQDVHNMHDVHDMQVAKHAGCASRAFVVNSAVIKTYVGGWLLGGQGVTKQQTCP